MLAYACSLVDKCDSVQGTCCVLFEDFGVSFLGIRMSTAVLDSIHHVRINCSDSVLVLFSDSLHGFCNFVWSASYVLRNGT